MAVLAIEVGLAEVREVALAGEHLVNGDDHRVRDSHGGFLGAPPSLEPVELRSEVGPLLSCRAKSGFVESALEPLRALLHLEVFPLARAEIVPGAEAGPGGEVLRRRELGHVGPDLSQKDLRCPKRNTGDRLETIQSLLKREHERPQALVELSDVTLDLLEMIEQEGEHELVMLGDSAP